MSDAVKIGMMSGERLLNLNGLTRKSAEKSVDSYESRRRGNNGGGGPKPRFGAGLCGRCGKPLDMAIFTAKKRHKYCKACKREHMRAWRKANPMTPEQRRKDSARSLAGVYLRRGKITRQPCQRCGSDKSQMHHHDYNKPLEVEWLCRRCHMLEHYA